MNMPAKTLSATPQNGAAALLSPSPPALSGTPSIAQNTPQPAARILLIDSRTLARECLARCLQNAYDAAQVHSFASVADCLAADPGGEVLLVLYGIHHHRASEREIEQHLTCLRQSFGAPVVVLADLESADRILEALERGARGYIPSSVSLEVAVKATLLVWAGGTFVPASSLIGLPGSAEGTRSLGAGGFTPRQLAVLHRLRQGKANKIIAHELRISESTVKVHVRNIMQKLKATNRTEVAFLTQNIHPEQPD
jgi:DNA-binding NarL/FixJ family response regulator